jgi:hypothetical protein
MLSRLTADGENEVLGCVFVLSLPKPPKRSAPTSTKSLWMGFTTPARPPEDATMISDFDDFCLWTYTIVDDLWARLAPLFKRPGPEPLCSDSELLTLAVVGECRGWDLETELLSLPEPLARQPRLVADQSARLSELAQRPISQSVVVSRHTQLTSFNCAVIRVSPYIHDFERLKITGPPARPNPDSRTPGQG